MKTTGNVTSATRLKARGTISAVKRSVCQRCGGCYGKSPAPHVAECHCEDGGVFTVIDLGVIADSGPMQFWPRRWWQFQQWIAGALATLKKRAAA